MKYLVFPLALMASQATAQENCMPREMAVPFLADTYGERQQIIAMTADGLFIEVFANAAGGWTLIGTTPDGMSCMLGHGQNFEIIAEPLGRDG